MLFLLPIVLLESLRFLPFSATWVDHLDFVVASGSQNSPSCALSKYRVVSSLSSKGIWFSVGEGKNLSSYNPYPGSTVISFAFSPGRGARAYSQDLYERSDQRKSAELMGNQELLLDWSSSLISNCKYVSKVSFGYPGSDYWQDFYRFPGGLTRRHICLVQPSEGSRGWGYSHCL